MTATLAATSAAPPTAPTVAPRPDVQRDPRTQPERHWFVLLHDDQEHTYDYVILMLVTLCAMTFDEALRHAVEVDTDGITVVGCAPQEEAENLAHQILRFGGDPMLGTSCSMKATVEPAHG